MTQTDIVVEVMGIELANSLLLNAIFMAMLGSGMLRKADAVAMVDRLLLQCEERRGAGPAAALIADGARRRLDQLMAAIEAGPA